MRIFFLAFLKKSEHDSRWKFLFLAALVFFLFAQTNSDNRAHIMMLQNVDFHLLQGMGVNLSSFKKNPKTTLNNFKMYLKIPKVVNPLINLWIKMDIIFDGIISL